MFKRMKLGTRIAAGFGALITIAMILGFAGYYSSVCGNRAVVELGVVRLPSVQSLQVVKQGGLDIKSAQRTLLNPDVDEVTRQRQHDLVAKARETYETAWKIYEPLPQTTEEAALWKEFVPAWQAWRDDNTEFFRLARELDALKIGNPVKLERDLALFRGDHYKLEAEVLQMISDKDLFEGGEDHTACRFGKWRQTAHIENPEVAAALREAEEPHRHFHECVKKIKDELRAGNADEAKKTLIEEMKPNAAKVFGAFDKILATANAATVLRDNLNQQGMEVCRATQQKANDLLDRIVKINEDVAAEATSEATQQAVFFKMLSLAAMLVGVAVGIVLAVFVTRGITRPIRRIIEQLSEGSEQVAAASGQV
jgi:methyl-accepting chemotaxis protein